MFAFSGIRVHIFRDDLLAGRGVLAGNKSRKLTIFRRVNLPYQKFISHGNAQSNAMAALAQLARERSMQLVFFAARPAPEAGNLAFARKAGAAVYFASELAAARPESVNLPYAAGLCALAREGAQPAELARFAHQNDPEGFLIPEGAALYEARFGAAEQARDLCAFAHERGICARSAAVFLPSGTGASAAWLAEFLPAWRVLSVDVGAPGAVRDFERRCGLRERVRVLQTRKIYRFGKIHYELYRAIKHAESAAGIKFELVYDPLGFLALFTHAKSLREEGISDVIYIHQGGALGDESMRARYEAKFSGAVGSEYVDDFGDIDGFAGTSGTVATATDRQSAPQKRLYINSKARANINLELMND